MIRRILGIIFVALLWVTTGCSDEPELDYGDFCEVFATYEGAEQGYATFSYCRHNDSPLLTLTAENVASAFGNCRPETGLHDDGNRRYKSLA